MASTKAKLATEITLDSTNFSKGLQNAINSLDQFRERNKKVAKETKGAYRNIADGLNNLVVGGFKIGVKAATAFGVAITALKAATLSWNAMVLKTSSKVAAEFEKLAVSFASLTGSAGKATEVLARLEEQSLKTGITVKDQANAVQKFLALGFDPERALRLNEAILDVAGSVGLTSFQANQLGFALAQVANKGVVQMEELRQQIAEKGVPVFEALEEKTGLFGNNLLKALKSNQVPAKVLLDIFENLEGRFENFRGGSERLGKTLLGTTDRLRAAIAMLQRIIGEQFNVQLQQFFERIFNFLVSLKDEARELGKVFAELGLAINRISQTFVEAFDSGTLKAKINEVLTLSMQAAGEALKIALLEAIEFVFKDIGKPIEEAGKFLQKWAAPTSEAIESGATDGFTAAADVIDSVIRPALVKAVVDTFVSAAENSMGILKGIGDIIRSAFSDSVNMFIADFQAGIELLPKAIKTIGQEILGLAVDFGNTIKVAILSSLVSLTQILPGLGGTEKDLKQQIKDISEATKKSREERQERSKQLTEEIFTLALKRRKQGTREELQESGIESIKNAIIDQGKNLEKLGAEVQKNPLEKVAKIQQESTKELTAIKETLKESLNIQNLDLPVQKEILKQVTKEETQREKDVREGKDWLEGKLGPPPEWASKFDKLDKFFGERTQTRLDRERGVQQFLGQRLPVPRTGALEELPEQTKKINEQLKEAGKNLTESQTQSNKTVEDQGKEIGEKLSEAAAKIQQGGEESSSAFKQAGQSSSEQMRQTAEETSNGLRRAGETIAQAAERLGLSIANSALDPKAFWKQVRKAGGMVATPEQVQAAFMSLDDWVKKQASFFANRTDPKPDWIQRWSEGNITEGLRNMVYEMYRKDLGLPLEPEPFKELTKQDRSQAFWQSVKDIQNKVVQNTSNLMSVSDKYGKQSYDAQRESNRLAKQNQTELAGINQRLGGLGLIAA